MKFYGIFSARCHKQYDYRIFHSLILSRNAVHLLITIKVHIIHSNKLLSLLSRCADMLSAIITRKNVKIGISKLNRELKVLRLIVPMDS